MSRKYSDKYNSNSDSDSDSDSNTDNSDNKTVNRFFFTRKLRGGRRSRATRGVPRPPRPPRPPRGPRQPRPAPKPKPKPPMTRQQRAKMEAHKRAHPEKHVQKKNRNPNGTQKKRLTKKEKRNRTAAAKKKRKDKSKAAQKRRTRRAQRRKGQQGKDRTPGRAVASSGSFNPVIVTPPGGPGFGDPGTGNATPVGDPGGADGRAGANAAAAAAAEAAAAQADVTSANTIPDTASPEERCTRLQQPCYGKHNRIRDKAVEVCKTKFIITKANKDPKANNKIITTIDQTGLLKCIIKADKQRANNVKGCDKARDKCLEDSELANNEGSVNGNANA